jgi:hypothetical protein
MDNPETIWKDFTMRSLLVFLLYACRGSRNYASVKECVLLQITGLGAFLEPDSGDVSTGPAHSTAPRVRSMENYDANQGLYLV